MQEKRDLILAWTSIAKQCTQDCHCGCCFLLFLMPLGKTLHGSTVYLPGSVSAFSNFCSSVAIYNLSKHTGIVNIVNIDHTCVYCPIQECLRSALPTSRHGEQHQQGPLQPASLWEQQPPTTRNCSVLFTLPFTVAPGSCSFLLKASKNSISDLFPTLQVSVPNFIL